MAGKTGPRHGSLQFWPRKRADRAIPRVNWKPIAENAKGAGAKFLGFIGYKAGMLSAYVKDMTPDSMTKNKKIVIPCTIIELPTFKIFSARFYKEGVVVCDILNDNIDRELRKKLRLPKQSKAKELIGKMEKERDGDYDDVRVIVYSQAKKTGIKKTPDIAEIGISGADKNVKVGLVKNNLAKEINFGEGFGKEAGIVDVRGMTKGKGTQGSVKRFGLKLRFHKSEKGRRGPGSIGPWHPARINFHVPFAGQLGFFNRIIYNSAVISAGKISEKDINPASGFKGYGKVRSDYLILQGSVQGPVKRQLLITSALRPTKKQLKKKYELIELR